MSKALRFLGSDNRLPHTLIPCICGKNLAFLSLKFYNQQISQPIHCKCSRNHSPRPDPQYIPHLTVRLLVSGSGTGTSKLLRLASSVISDQQRSVVLDKGLLQRVLAVLIDVLLIVCNDRLGDGLADGVDLGCVSTSGNSDADVDASELVQADNQEGFVDLESQDLGLDEVERLSVDLDQSLTSLAVGDGGCCLLLAEALHTLGCRCHDYDWR